MRVMPAMLNNWWPRKGGAHSGQHNFFSQPNLLSSPDNEYMPHLCARVHCNAFFGGLTSILFHCTEQRSLLGTITSSRMMMRCHLAH
jgi:hypothetical protein